MLNPSVVSTHLLNTMHSDQNIRKHSSTWISNSMTTNQFGPLMLHLVNHSLEKNDQNLTLVAVITFKNFIKKYWDSEDDGVNKIVEADRVEIKNSIIKYMLKSPEKIQKFFSETIAIIGKYDFPEKWPNLFDELVSSLATDDFNIINGVLLVAHSITKRYRYESKSDNLWKEIKFVLNKFAAPLTELFIKIVEMVEKLANDKNAITVLASSLVLCSKIFLSLNSQDLPEEFEDEMKNWMPRFQNLLIFENELLEKDALETESTSIEYLKSTIIQIANLYTNRYDEEFKDYLQDFIMKIWQLLTNTKEHSRYDILVFTCVNFLANIAKRPQTKLIFGEDNPETNEPIPHIFEKIIIPNSRLRDLDIENFECDPDEFIRADLEGSDNDTRRRAANDLIKGLSKFFENTMTSLASGHIKNLMDAYNVNMEDNFLCKEAALFLVTALITKSTTRKNGVTSVSNLVSVTEFYDMNILNELADGDIGKKEILRSSCIKFSIHFRNQIGKDRLVNLIPHLTNHLLSQNTVLKSYAAHAIERCMIMKDTKFTLLEIGNENVKNLVNNLCQGVALAENKFIMRALLRILSLIYKDTQRLEIPKTAILTLKGALERASKNPSEPDYNHYMFECIAATVRINLKNNNLNDFQDEFFPLFTLILENDITEFMPYVFQVISLVLEHMPEGSLKSNNILTNLFNGAMMAAIWENSGNIPPLARLVGAFISRKDASHLIKEKINNILGIFQKLIMSKANDHHAFFIVNCMIVYLDNKLLEPYLSDVMRLIFRRIQAKKTNKVVRGLLLFLSTVILNQSVDAAINLVEKVQNGMFGMIVEKLILPDLILSASAGSLRERRAICYAMTLLLTSESRFLEQENISKLWEPTLSAVLHLFDTHKIRDEDVDQEDDMPDDITLSEGGLNMDESQKLTLTKSYQAAFTALNFAGLPNFDPLPKTICQSNGHHQLLAAGLKNIGQDRLNIMCNGMDVKSKFLLGKILENFT